MEGAATTVYAQGGRGNTRLVAWEGERTITFTMEDALISPAGFMILSGAGLVDASSEERIYVHATEQTDKVVVTGTGENVTSVEIELESVPAVYDAEDPNNKLRANEDYIYVMVLDENGEVKTEPFIPTSVDAENKTLTLAVAGGTVNGRTYTPKDLASFTNGCVVLVDYYVEKQSNAQQIDITPDKFGGNYYLEASTLFRAQNGVDMPAEFIIPNCKIQSNFTFTMASSGDPSTFTFTMDAFPDYTRFDRTKKVLAAIQIIGTSNAEDTLVRETTRAGWSHSWDDSANLLINEPELTGETV